MKKVLLLMMGCSIAVMVSAQKMPAFKSLRYEEDYRVLKNDSNRNWYRRLKYQLFRKTSPVYNSIGGEVRLQGLVIKNAGWGDDPPSSTLLTRVLLHSHLHAGAFSSFFQLQSSLSTNQTAASPVNHNQLEIHQAFVDYTGTLNNQHKWLVRVGRQELLYGSQRLISVRDGPNNRQSFDAIRFIYNQPQARMDVWYSWYVKATKGFFNDPVSNQVQFWGFYYTQHQVPFFHHIDAYYLGLYKQRAVFDDGIGYERRHTIGTRVWNDAPDWKYDIEGAYQFGQLAHQTISAYTLSANTSYTFTKAVLKPTIGIKTELISGNRIYGDQRLQTFNPLFPRGAYFGLAALIGPANLIDVHPSVGIELSKKWSMDVELDAFWRYSISDGLYAVNLASIYSGKNNLKKYIGTQSASSVIFKPDQNWYFRYEITIFDAGAFLKTAGSGKTIIFNAVTTQLKF